MMTKTDWEELEYRTETGMLGDKINDITPPPVNPTYWRDKLDDAQQEGYINGYADADESRPTRVLLALSIGYLIGLITGFFTFYKG
jgi:hypothetical protein